MKKRFLAVALCTIIMMCFVPATALAANGSVSIKGLSVSAATPYYFNDNGTSGSPTKDGQPWNAYLEIEDGEYTLHLNGLSITDFSEPTVISTTNIDTLYLLLESNDNKVYTRCDDTGTAAIRCDNLVVNGDGSLEAKALGTTAGSGIVASSIKLQYPANLIVKGATKATSVQVKNSEGSSAYKAANSTDAEITDYFSNGARFETEPYVHFTPQANAYFPLWVDGGRVTAGNMNSIPVSSGSAAYTPASGSAPARLTLNGATIDSSYTSGNNGAGVYAWEPLEIYLVGSNTINFIAPASNASTYGVFAPALTITAENPGASLLSSVRAANGSGVGCCGISAGGSGSGKITINGGVITAHGLADTGKGTGIHSSSTLDVKGGIVTAECQGSGTDTFAVRAQTLTLGTGMAINTPVGGKAPGTDSGGVKHYIMDSDENGVRNVVIDRAAPVEYQITQGADGTWTKGGSAGLAFTANADYSKLTDVMVDGAQIASDKYTKASGSTVVTLAAAYLETLGTGQHTLRMNFTDGYAETHFTVNAATVGPVVPTTGDDSLPPLMAGILLTVGIALAATGLFIRRKRRDA